MVEFSQLAGSWRRHRSSGEVRKRMLSPHSLGESSAFSVLRCTHWQPTPPKELQSKPTLAWFSGSHTEPKLFCNGNPRQCITKLALFVVSLNVEYLCDIDVKLFLFTASRKL